MADPYLQYLRLHANVFVKGFPPHVDGQDLVNTFCGFGEIVSTKVAKSESGEPLRYGYVQFLRMESADRAVQTMNGAKMEGEAISVEKFVPKIQRDKTRPFSNVYIRNIPARVREEKDLVEIFEDFGEIKSAYLARGENGELRGFGFVDFADPKSAQHAIDSICNGEIECGDIRVAPAQTKQQRKASRNAAACKARGKTESANNGESLIVRGLNYSINDATFYKMFSEFGEIVSARVMKTRDGLSCGYGFVTFKSVNTAANAARCMDGKVVCGRRISANIAIPREEHKRQKERAKKAEMNGAYAPHSQMFASFYPYPPSNNWPGFMGPCAPPFSMPPLPSSPMYCAPILPTGGCVPHPSPRRPGEPAGDGMTHPVSAGPMFMRPNPHFGSMQMSGPVPWSLPAYHHPIMPYY